MNGEEVVMGVGGRCSCGNILKIQSKTLARQMENSEFARGHQLWVYLYELEGTLHLHLPFE